MVTVASTTVTCTYLKGEKLQASKLTASNIYVVVPGMSFPSVPAGSKLFWNILSNKSSAGTMDWRIRDVTNNQTLKEVTGQASGSTVQDTDLSGTVVVGGSAGTIELQFLSSDANNANIFSLSNGVSWLCITDCSIPLVISGGPALQTFSGKRQIGTLRGFFGPVDTTAADADNFSLGGLPLVGKTAVTETVEDNFIAYDVITSELILTYDGSADPIWIDVDGAQVVIIGYDGFNIEVTG